MGTFLLRVRDLPIMMARMGMVQVRHLFGKGWFWSGALCAATFSRGSSFISRPPNNDTIAAGAVQAFISYRTWGYMLLVAAVLIVAAHSSKRLRICGIFGHLFGMWAYATFGLSTIIGALWFGQSWATAGTFMCQSLLHAACAIYLGDEVGIGKEVRRD